MVELNRNLRGLVLSATELSGLMGWPEAMIEDYLTMLENLITLAEGVQDSISKVPGAIEGNLPTFDDGGEIEDSGESIDTIRSRSYFYGRVY